MAEAITFDSDGLSLSGVLHRPEGVDAEDLLPAFLVLHGFGVNMAGQNELATCDLLTHWGYGALRFDFRGCGESEGRRGNIIWEEESKDVSNAVTYLSNLRGIDTGRIGVIGHSYGGAISIAAGAADERLAVVISSCGWGNGEVKCRAQHPSEEAWAAFEARINEGRRRREAGEEALMISRWDIVPIPESLRGLLPAGSAMEFTVETIESMLSFRGEDMVGAIAPRPLLLLHAANDSVTPTEQSLRLFDRAQQPADLFLVSDVDHFPLAGDDPMAKTMVKRWLDEYLPAKT